MKSRKALTCTLGAVVAALFLAVTWSTMAARSSAITTVSSEAAPATAARNSTHRAPRRLVAQTAATVATDKSDYPPGSTVTVTGTGWAPGETVTLTFSENPQNDGPHILTTVADGSGNIRSTDFIVSPQDAGITFTLTATGSSSGLTATATFADTPQCDSGTGVVTVAGNGGSCVGQTPPQGGGPFNWEVAEGGSYTMTISGVTECTDNTITVFVQNSETGNFCFNALMTSSGTYTGSFMMPSPTCFTSPISYKCGADQPCDNANNSAINARGPGGACTVHLRASIFDAQCTKTGDDTVCTGGPPQQCTISLTCPSDIGPVCHDPGDCTGRTVTYTTPTASGTNCAGNVSVTCSPASGSKFPVGTTTVTCTATDQATPTPNKATCTFNVTVGQDTTKPVLSNVPTGGDLGCNPTTLPSCATRVTATDDCDGTVIVTCTPGAVTGSDCNKSQTFTYSAQDSCGNKASQDVTYTWKVDTTKPVLHNVPTGGDLGCNPTTLPSCASGVTATDNCDGTVTVTCTPGAVTGTDCNKSQTFSYSAQDRCGNKASQDVTYTWKVDTTPPTITCPVIASVQLQSGQCSAAVTFAPAVSDNCGGPVNVVCNPPSGSSFSPGVTSVTCTATDTCLNSNQCSFNVTVYTSITVHKFYDANANGKDDDGQVVNGLKITLGGAASGIQFTDGSGNTTFSGLLPGNYTVTEVLPNSFWVNTTGGTSITINNLTCPQSVSFGNYCFTPPANGLTLGYWSNKNGQNVLQGHDPAWRTLLNGLNLRNADGTCFTVPTSGPFNTAYGVFRTWLLGATATNMAYMLSAQLATTELDVAFNGLSASQGVIVPGGVKTGTGVCIVPFLSATQSLGTATSTACPSLVCSPVGQPLVALTTIPGSTACGCSSNNGLVTIGNLEAAAIALLCSYGNTTAAGTARTYEESVKDILDMINNNGNNGYACGGITQFISASPCTFTSPY